MIAHRSLLLALPVAIALSASACAHRAPDPEPVPDPLSEVTAGELARRGRAQLAAGDSVRAEQYLAAALERGAAEPEIVPLLLRACVSGGRYRVALRHARDYLRRHPGDWRVRYFAGALALATGQAANARAELERVVAERPDLAEAHYLLAQVLGDKLGEGRAASAALRRYLELRPEGEHAAAARAALAAGAEKEVPR